MQPPVQEKLDEFYRLAHERQAIWRRRADGLPAPWTEDPVFLEWRFTNVFRELDAGTVRLVRAMADAAEDGAEAPDTVFNVWLYRELNNRDSWEEVTGGRFLRLEALDQGWLAGRMDARRQSGRPLFTGAHMTPSLKTVVEALPVVVSVAGPLAKRLERMTDLQDVFEHMRCLPGVGNFLGYQMAQDLTYGPRPATQASVDEWALAGPGALGGLGVLFGRRVTPGEAVTCMAQLRDLQDETLGGLGLDFASVAAEGRGRLGLSAVEHWTCEYMKYHRIAHEGGTGKNRYRA
jgi:hypothetical protein